MMPEVEFARDKFGNVLGGIRLAAHDVPTAKNTGMNYGATNRFCFLYGSHEPFTEATLNSLYPDHDAYVSAVRDVVRQILSMVIFCLTPQKRHWKQLSLQRSVDEYCCLCSKKYHA